MSDILDEGIPNEKEKRSPFKSMIKFEEGEEEYGRSGCLAPFGIMLFVIILLIIGFIKLATFSFGP